MTSEQNLRVAIVHYWFAGYTGGEHVVEALAEMFPQADLFALVADPAMLTPALRKHRLTTSFLQKIPGSVRWHSHLLPFQPLALEQLDVSGYDLILSSESGPAKGIVSPTRACHVCYCHSPMRYVWDMYHAYRKSVNPLVRAVFSLTAHHVRLWDLASADRVDYFVANSRNVAARIRKHYRRDSAVIYPPSTVPNAGIAGRTEDYYLVVSRLVDYKRVDLAIEACHHLGRRLRIVGEGSEYKRLRRMAGADVEFAGHLSAKDLHDSYARCRALVFPGEEDFGIVPVEVQCFGRPVIAYGRGGALETVIGLTLEDGFDADHSTGVFFTAQSVESLSDALRRFESVEERFDPRFIQASVRRFDLSQFQSGMRDFIERCLAEHLEPAEPLNNRRPTPLTLSENTVSRSSLSTDSLRTPHDTLVP